MNLRFASPLLALVCLFFGVANASDKVRELNWEDLMPPEELEAWLSGEQPMQDLEMMFSDDDPARPPAGVVRELDGQRVKIPGFVVPLESDEGGKMTEFFLVPYFGACIHVPPPPPNQIVYVTLEKFSVFMMPVIQYAWYMDSRKKGSSSVT